ncbi:MAG: YcnI family protein [Paenibacillaceae bacterium]
MRKMIAIIATLWISSILFSGIASAHVTVYPKETLQGAYEKFTVRVPTEKEVPTTEIKVLIPEHVNVSRFEPKSGWDYEVSRDTTDKIISVIWTASGEGLSSTEFGEFNMQGKVGGDATHIIWKAYQTYQDGSVVEWIGDEGTDKPASITTVLTIPADDDDDASSLPIYLSIVAIILSLLSVLIAYRRR